jgi:DNA-binding transcriptional ArsR family regulator
MFHFMSPRHDVAPGAERITNARRVRALAHPLRLELLDMLRDGELTASECAERTGESPASCSFHLRTLAKYGYIERGDQRGREKPWRLVSRSRELRPDYDDPASVRAVGAMATVALDQQIAHVRALIDRLADEPSVWVDSSTITSSALWATREELAEISDTLQHIADRFHGRNEDPRLRPIDARPIRVLGVAVVDVAREQRQSRQRSDSRHRDR